MSWIMPFSSADGSRAGRFLVKSGFVDIFRNAVSDGMDVGRRVEGRRRGICERVHFDGIYLVRWSCVDDD